jgi:hypothetical protein
MTPHRLFNLALASAIAVVLSCAYLLDGPGEIEASRATAASVADAKAMACAAYVADAKEARK